MIFSKDYSKLSQNIFIQLGKTQIIITLVEIVTLKPQRRNSRQWL